MAYKNFITKVSWLRLLYLLIAAIFIYLVITQISSLKGSLHQIRTSNLSNDAYVVVAIAATYFFAALTYYLIAVKPLKYLRTVVVELGINTLNRLLPAGIGGIGANYLYMLKTGHHKVQAATVVALNNTLGAIGNLLLLGILLILVKGSPFVVGRAKLQLIGLIILIIVICSGAVYLLPKARAVIKHHLKTFFSEVKSFKQRKLRLLLGLVSSIGLTLANITALLFSLQAVHGHLALSSIALAFSFAIWLGAVIPAPGGIGSVEAGLVGALVAYHIGLSQAVAAVLVFRLISFWIPLILGIPALVWSRKRGYF